MVLITPREYLAADHKSYSFEVVMAYYLQYALGGSAARSVLGTFAL